MGGSATVVVPVYKAGLSADEQFSLAQTHRVLAAHERIAVGPGWLFEQRPPWLAAFSGFEVFPDECFAGLAGYNALMLSTAFYARFRQRPYLLICQTDALPLRDELEFWCAQGYDYVGAPWLPDIDRYRFKALATWRQQRRALRSLRLDKRDAKGHPRNSNFYFQVGNGGFSLRRVDKMIALLDEHAGMRDRFVTRYREHRYHAYNEDLFFGVGARQAGADLKMPDWRTAARFSLEDGLPWAFSLLDGQLPFGCHAWAKHRAEWQPAFTRIGLLPQPGP